MTDATKPCTKCERAKPLVAFNRRRASPDGLQPICRECERQRKRAYYVANRDVILAGMRAANAANPEANRRKAKEWARRNPERARAREQTWRAEHPELVRQWGRDFARRHPLRVKANTAKQRARRRLVPTVAFTVEQLAARLSMWPGCWMCGGPKESIDHVKPLAKGGAHMLGNIRPACGRCNSAKGDTWPYIRAI